jgi:ComF family protein
MNRFLEGLLALLFPQRTVCHVCGAPLSAAESLLCAPCAAALRRCALPPKRAEIRLVENIGFAASAFAYRGTASALVKALKFGSDYTAALPLAEGMAGIYAALGPLRDAELCVPVPVHRRRLRQRGYNQAAILAQAFAEFAGLPPAADALTRVHHKRSQIGQGREARKTNVYGAFAVSEGGAQTVSGKTVLLIDDVLTTGATAEECARTLLLAGARRVMLLTAAYAL